MLVMYIVLWIFTIGSFLLAKVCRFMAVLYVFVEVVRRVYLIQFVCVDISIHISIYYIYIWLRQDAGSGWDV